VHLLTHASKIGDARPGITLLEIVDILKWSEETSQCFSREDLVYEARQWAEWWESYHFS
jgi:hypothetical protein